MELVKLTEKQKALDVLEEFSDIFPHLCEKVDNIENYAEKLIRYSNFYIARQDGENFGLAVFYSNDFTTKTAYISLIGIKKVSQGKGLGKWLLVKCEEESKKQGMTKISLEVDCDNVGAITFYKKNGFVIGTHTERNSMYMHKNL